MEPFLFKVVPLKKASSKGSYLLVSCRDLLKVTQILAFLLKTSSVSRAEFFHLLSVLTFYYHIYINKEVS